MPLRSEIEEKKKENKQQTNHVVLEMRMRAKASEED